jgi:hypothetical protein
MPVSVAEKLAGTVAGRHVPAESVERRIVARSPTARTEVGPALVPARSSILGADVGGMEARSGVETKATRRETTKKPDGDIGLIRRLGRGGIGRGGRVGDLALLS